jgi:hypothetical protein
LRTEVDFSGAFTIDGVVTARGFLPTELNPRSGAGLNVMLRALPDLPLQLLLDALVGGVDLDYDSLELERDLVVAADATRSGGTWRAFPDPRSKAIDERRLDYDGASWHRLTGDDGGGDAECDAVVAVGGGPSGTFVRAVFDRDRTPVGESVAARAADFWRYADSELGTGIGPLTSAIAV